LRIVGVDDNELTYCGGSRAGQGVPTGIRYQKLNGLDGLMIIWKIIVWDMKNLLQK